MPDTICAPKTCIAAQRWLVVPHVILLALLGIGVIPTAVQAQPAGGTSGFDISNVPETAVLLVGLKPSQLAQHAELQPLLSAIESARLMGTAGVSANHLSQCLLIVTPRDSRPAAPTARPAPQRSTSARGGELSVVIELRTFAPATPQSIVAAEYGEVRPQTVDDVELLASVDLATSPDANAARIDEAGTLFFGPASTLVQLAATRSRGRSGPSPALVTLASDENSDAFIVGDLQHFRPLLMGMMKPLPTTISSATRPLVRSADLAVARFRFNSGVQLTLTEYSPDTKSASEVQKSFGAVLAMANTLLQSREESFQRAAPKDDEQRAAVEQTNRLTRSLLQSARVQQQQQQVTLTTRLSSEEVSLLAERLAPMLVGVRGVPAKP